MLLPNPFRLPHNLLPHSLLPVYMLNRSSLVVASMAAVCIGLASWGAVLDSSQPPASGLPANELPVSELPPSKIPSSPVQEKSPNGGSSTIQDDPLFQEIKSRAGSLPSLIDGKDATGGSISPSEPRSTIRSKKSNQRVYRAAEAMLRSARLLEAETKQSATEANAARRDELQQVVARLREDARRVLQAIPSDTP